MNKLFDKLCVLRAPRIGPVRYAKLISQFGTPAAAVEALGLGAEHFDKVHREMDEAAEKGIHYISDNDDIYPQMLRRVKNHPPVITVRGNLDVLRRPMVSIVGTRHATAAGMGFVREMAREFALRGIVVVSGMAMGTDTAAHAGALAADGSAQTVAVLAGGADYIWPLENESLYRRILERGAIISEMPVGFVPNQTNFVQRNRWIAGLSEKLILGEADINSGSMTTARFAAEYGREVWAIPSHPADSRAAGPNSLIAAGTAKLCSGISDFFNSAPSCMGNEKKLNSENSLLDAIGSIAVSESVLTEIVKKSISEIKRDLVILELQGLIRKTDGGYVRT
ncbi:MAG: DNA-processing protein DprA [Alphaproteobacteria bacterium]|nr:DNA-processing protein DprA [Alphaproteobacteria bacterium]